MGGHSLSGQPDHGHTRIVLDRITANLEFNGRALVLRAERQQVLASNIANADTPDYQARDFDFGRALQAATKGVPAAEVVTRTDARHMTAPGTRPGAPTLQYRVGEQPAGDRNTVDLDRERANFADNAVRYEATLRFVNGNVRQLMSAIRGD